LRRSFRERLNAPVVEVLYEANNLMTRRRTLRKETLAI